MSHSQDNNTPIENISSYQLAAELVHRAAQTAASAATTIASVASAASDATTSAAATVAAAASAASEAGNAAGLATIQALVDPNAMTYKFGDLTIAAASSASEAGNAAGLATIQTLVNPNATTYQFGDLTIAAARAIASNVANMLSPAPAPAANEGTNVPGSANIDSWLDAQDDLGGSFVEISEADVPPSSTTGDVHPLDLPFD